MKLTVAGVLLATLALATLLFAVSGATHAQTLPPSLSFIIYQGNVTVNLSVSGPGSVSPSALT